MIKRAAFLALLAACAGAAAAAAEIAHVFAAQNTLQTTTSTSYVDVAGAAIGSSNFTAGRKYLLWVTAQIGNNTQFGQASAQLVHGSTAFEGSALTVEIGIANGKNVYAYATVWTATAGEDVRLQFKTDSGKTAQADQAAIFAMCLSTDLVENTDWFFAERTNNDPLSTTPADGASITFTPGSAGHDWLVLTTSSVSTSSTATLTSKMVRTGEASSSVPQAIWGVGDSSVSSALLVGLARVFTLGQASNTFKEQSVAGATTHTRVYSNIFALDLNKFAAHTSAYTEADVNLGTVNYATALQSASITPGVAGDVLLGGYAGFDTANAARQFEFRLQVDGSDQPAGQTADNYQLKYESNAANELAHSLVTVAALSSAAHTLTLDGSANSTTSSPSAQQRSVWAFTMTLAGGTPPSAPRKRVLVAQ